MTRKITLKYGGEVIDTDRAAPNLRRGDSKVGKDRDQGGEGANDPRHRQRPFRLCGQIQSEQKESQPREDDFRKEQGVFHPTSLPASR